MEKDINIFIYNNSFSFFLIDNYIKTKTITNYMLINISKKYNPNASINCTNFFLQIFFLFKIRNYINIFKKNNLNTNVNLYVPNFNNLICNCLCNEKFSKNITLVIEGTLNFRKRVKESLFKKCIKFFIAKLIFLNFSFVKDPLSYDKSGINLITYDFLPKPIGNFKNIYKLNYLPHCYKPERNVTLILGQHLLESKKNRINLNTNRMLSLFKNNKIYYIPHPRSIDNGRFELDNVYKFLNPSIIKTNQPAEEIIQKYKPENIISIGGSSLFLYPSSEQINFFALGINELAKKDMSYKSHLKLYKSLNVKIL